VHLLCKLNYKQLTVRQLPNPLTVDGEAGLAGVGGAKVVGDDALVAALVGEGHVTQVEDGGVLRHTVAPGNSSGGRGARGRLGHGDGDRVTLRRGVGAVGGVGKVLGVAVAQQLLVLAPGEGDGRGAAAGCRAGEAHVAAQHRHRGLRLHRDLGLGEVVWRGGMETPWRCEWEGTVREGSSLVFSSGVSNMWPRGRMRPAS